MYKSALFHLHSILEGSPATMSGYCHEAQRYGIDVVWISDHDSKYFREGEFDIRLDEPFSFEEVGHPSSVSIGRSDKAQPSLSVRVEGSGEEWGGVGLRLPNVASKTRVPLIAQPKVAMRMSTDVGADSSDRRLVLRVHLGQAPPDHVPVFFDYGLGAMEEADGQWVPLPFADGESRIDLLKDIEAGGLTADHMPQGYELRVEARNGASASVDVQAFSVKGSLATPEDLFAAQTELARKLGEQFGVTVLVSYEASAEDGHMTCFGPAQRMLYTPERRPPRQEISQHMDRAGGAVSINHPFSPWKKEEFSDEEKWEIVRQVADDLLADGAHGAHAVEVGFPEGRHNFEAEHYFALLDILNRRGLRLVGIGVSDAHRNKSWEDGNNFANWIASPDCDPANLAAGIRKGDLYMADPARVHGQLKMRTDQGKGMGDTQADGSLFFEIDGVPRGCELRWIVDGECAKREPCGEGCKSQIALADAKRFVRAELHDAYGRLLLATNPVWTA